MVSEELGRVCSGEVDALTAGFERILWKTRRFEESSAGELKKLGQSLGSKVGVVSAVLEWLERCGTLRKLMLCIED